MIIKTVKFRRRGFARKLGKLGFKTGYEIGVKLGKYSEVLCQENKKLSLKSVDPYTQMFEDVRSNRLTMEEEEANFQQAKKRLESRNCEIIRKTSMEAVIDVPYESIDFVYIDGSHQFDYVMCDIIEWAKRVKKGGIVSGHDYYRFNHGNVVDAVNIYCREHRIKKLYLTDEKESTWWFTKE